MKEIKAYIKPHKLPAVTLALHQIEGLTGLSVSDTRGFGRSKGKSARHRAADDLVDYAPHARIEVVCQDELVEAVIEAIQQNAHTGLQGDGKIYVTPVETAVRIQTGERGENAV